MKTYFVEFIDNDSGVCFHHDIYTSLNAVNELVTMWGNCFTIVSVIPSEDDDWEPVSGWWVLGEFAKLVAMPVTVVAGSMSVWVYQAEVAQWVNSALTSVLSFIH